MKRLNYSIFILIFSIFGALAQNSPDAETVINDFLNSTKSSAIRSNFSLKIIEKNELNSQSLKGTFTMKANKFVLEMADSKAWFDGVTLWVYLTDANEVSITEPTSDELSAINPVAVLEGYKAKSTIKFSDKKSSQNHIVVLRPKQKKEDFSLIEVQISKSAKELVSLSLTDKNGVKTQLNFANYQKGLNLGNDYFKFNKNNYKQVIINDLR